MVPHSENLREGFAKCCILTAALMATFTGCQTASEPAADTVSGSETILESTETPESEEKCILSTNLFACNGSALSFLLQASGYAKTASRLASCI